MANRLVSIGIQGYRPFGDFTARFGPLEVLVGANGSGKSSLFEFLKFLRDSIYQEIPPEIVPGGIGQLLFHIPGPERFSWDAEIDTGQRIPLRYRGELLGPVGRTRISYEKVETAKPLRADRSSPLILMSVEDGRGIVYDKDTGRLRQQDILLKRPNQLALSTMTNPGLFSLYNLREYISGWRFYSSFSINNQKIRKSVPIEQEPVLHEDAGNLSSVLHYLMTEHYQTFDELQQYIRLAVPGFERLTVKARGGPGEIIAFWREKGIDQDLSLADLSDGILRLICWMVLSVQPNPPTLVCIDEPDQGVHPRTLPILAGLFEKACDRTQMLLATHASYFLTQFDISRIAVMRKTKGEAEFIKPADSAVMTENLTDFGVEELEAMHRSDELERLP